MGAAWEDMEGGKGRGNGKLYYCNTKHYLKVIKKEEEEAKRDQCSTSFLSSVQCRIPVQGTVLSILSKKGDVMQLQSLWKSPRGHTRGLSPRLL